MNPFDSLPLETLDIIAEDEPAYRALLSITRFAASLTPGRLCNFMIKFGYSIGFSNMFNAKSSQIWLRDGQPHMNSAPFADYSRRRVWAQNGVLTSVETYGGYHRTTSRDLQEDTPQTMLSYGQIYWTNGKKYICENGLRSYDGLVVDPSGKTRIPRII